MLTREQRYWQAVRKARIIERREFREFLAGQRPWLNCHMDRERDILMRELDCAYRIGVEDGRQQRQ